MSVISKFINWFKFYLKRKLTNPSFLSSDFLLRQQTDKEQNTYP